jgi:hypothetical protein
VIDINHPSIRSIIFNICHDTITGRDDISPRIEREVHPLMERTVMRERGNSIPVMRGDIALRRVSYRKGPKSPSEGIEPAKEVLFSR